MASSVRFYRTLEAIIAYESCVYNYLGFTILSTDGFNISALFV